MTLKPITVAILLSASVSAYAVGPGNLGVIDNLPIDMSNVVPMGTFQDVFSFTIENPGELSGNLVPINFGAYNVLGLKVTLQDSTFTKIGEDSSPWDGFTFSSLAAGNYALNVLGYANGTSGGFYAGGMVATTAPVPEPETYAMMLAGLAAVGFMAARRRRDS